MYRTASTTKNYLTQDVNSYEIEKFCFRVPLSVSLHSDLSNNCEIFSSVNFLLFVIMSGKGKFLNSIQCSMRTWKTTKNYRGGVCRLLYTSRKMMQDTGQCNKKTEGWHYIGNLFHYFMIFLGYSILCFHIILVFFKA